MTDGIAYWVPVATAQAFVLVFAAGLAFGLVLSWLGSLVLHLVESFVKPWAGAWAERMYARWCARRDRAGESS